MAIARLYYVLITDKLCVVECPEKILLSVCWLPINCEFYASVTLVNNCLVPFASSSGVNFMLLSMLFNELLCVQSLFVHYFSSSSSEECWSAVFRRLSCSSGPGSQMIDR